MALYSCGTMSTGRSPTSMSVTPRHHDGALDRVLELADVPGPRMREHLLLRVVGETDDLLAVVGGEALDEVLPELQDVRAPHTERGHVDLHDVETVEEILPEAALAHVGDEIAVGRGDQAHVDVEGLAPADPLEAFLLEHAQQLICVVIGSHRFRPETTSRLPLARSVRCAAFRRR